LISAVRFGGYLAFAGSLVLAVQGMRRLLAAGGMTGQRRV